MKLTRIRHKVSSSLILTILIALIVILLRLVGIFEQTELNLFDLYYKLAPAEARDERIVLIGITEEDIAKLKTNRLSDWQLYQILSTIAQGHPAAVGIDIFRDHPVPPNYWELRELKKQGIAALNSAEPFGNQEFLSIFKSHSNFFAVGKQAGIKGDKNFDLIAPPPVPQQQIADVGVVLDSDGVQRRGFLYQVTKDPAIPSLSWALAQKYLEAHSAKIDGVSRNGEYHLKVNNTIFWKFRKYNGAYLKADDGGYQVLLNWRKSDFQMVPVTDILEGKINPDQFKDRIVIVGAYAPSLNDLFLTPINSEWGDSPRRIYGIEAIAQVTSYIISAVFDDRPTMLTWREPWISFAILACGMITGYLLKRIKVERLNVSLLFVFWVSLGLLGLFYFLLLSIGYWVPMMPIIVVIYSTAIAQYGLRTTLKRIADFNSIEKLSQERQLYITKLENTIDKRLHHRLMDNRLSSLGEDLETPLQNLILIHQSWTEQENIFIDYFHKSKISEVARYEGKLLVAGLMVILAKSKENLEYIKNKLSVAIPNLSHLDDRLRLMEVNSAFSSALEEVRNLYLGVDDLSIDIKPSISITDRRIKKEQYIQVFRLKILLAHLLDQPIRSLYLQSGKLPQIEFILKGDSNLIQLNAYIWHIYEPSEYSLYRIHKIIEYNNGSLNFYHENNGLVWSISFCSEN